jgi:hypothetical protein
MALYAIGSLTLTHAMQVTNDSVCVFMEKTRSASYSMFEV